MTLTREQEGAANHLCEHYDSVRVDDPDSVGVVRLTGILDGTDSTRWIVRPDGTILGAWVPDGLALIAVDEYLTRDEPFPRKIPQDF